MKQKKKAPTRIRLSLFLAIGVLLIVLLVLLSVALGAASIELSTTWQAFTQFDSDNTQHQIIRSLRLPRTLADIIVGSSLAVTGAMMQATTRNPMADSGLMGISSGAAFAVALSMALFPGQSHIQLIIFACIGAAVSTTITYGLAMMGKRPMSPQRLILSGIAVSMLFSALSSLISLQFHLGQSMTYWFSGGSASVNWDDLQIIAPFFFITIIISISIGRGLTLINLGDEIAAGLGAKVSIIKLVTVILVFVLSALSVMLVGPISFVGLIVPHVVRFFVGIDYRAVIPASIVYGAVFLLLADLVGRLINRPNETPLGIIFAMIGVPFFLFLSNRTRREFE
ncbi:FecCD family ABC transporter permease [Brochothrix thermosphacta]|uniref:FecCD family ABC transporter permease n=1 Tax=Brochothrix thermosphacta TaxID=2756 RepID=UPI000D0F335F|nr:iron ABC transporter permease [Brochothrix thermosphacta]SOC00444.1 ferrichrome ABC transporter (permease) [Brochothrix thermosphacta]